MGAKKKKHITNSSFLFHELVKSVWKILINPGILTHHVVLSLHVALLIASQRTHVSYSRQWLRNAIRPNLIRLRGEGADPAWEPSKAHLLPKHHKSCTVKWLFLMLLKRTDINIHSDMYCPLNYQRAQFTHAIHLDQQWSKVGSRDPEKAPDSVRGGLNERRDSFNCYSVTATQTVTELRKVFKSLTRKPRAEWSLRCCMLSVIDSHVFSVSS